MTRTAPPPVLGPAWLDALVEQAIDDRLAVPERRDLLLRDLPAGMAARLPHKGSGADQLRSDLAVLGSEAREGRAQPLASWLQQASGLVGPFHGWWTARIAEITSAEAPGTTEDPHEPTFDAIDQLTAGLGPIAASRLRSLVDVYCGTPDAPAPFAGRDADLDRLRAWALGDAGARLAVLDAPTGRGKTALLCHLVTGLVGSVEVVFHPFSERFDTAAADIALSALLARLTRLHGQSYTHVASPAETRALLSSYLRRPLPDGRRLVVVLDGIDEATGLPLGPDLIPRLPASTRVLVSVRSSAHLDGPRLIRRLGWRRADVDCLSLAPLDRPAVDALVARHLPALADDPTTGQRLFEQSGEGDPFVLGLLIEEWMAHGPDPDAPSIDGLAGLWERQSRRLEEDAMVTGGPAWTVIAALASAVGPLGRDDLLDLLSDAVPSGPALDKALSVVGRFVLQPGPGAYVFCHARLRQYVQETLLSPAEREGWQVRIARWALERVAAAETCSGRSIPGYVAQSLVHHLERVTSVSGLTEDWLAGWSVLLTCIWFEARERHGGLPGYIGDLEALRGVLQQDDARTLSDGKPPRHLERLVHCALCMVSARQAVVMPRDTLLLGVAEGRITPVEALAALRHQPAPSQGSPDFGSVGEGWRVLVDALDSDLLPEALEVAITCEEWALLTALIDRAAEWLPIAGWTFLHQLPGHLQPVTLLARLCHGLPADADPELSEAARTHLLTACRLIPSVELERRFHLLDGIVAPEVLLEWTEAALDVLLSGENAVHRADDVARLAERLPKARREAPIRRLMALGCTAESGDRHRMVHAIAGRAPDLVPAAVDVLRGAGLLDDLAPMVWSTPRGAQFASGPDEPPISDWRPQWGPLAAALSAAERAHLVDVAAEIVVTADRLPVTHFWTVGQHLPPAKVVELLARIEGENERRWAMRGVVARLPPDDQMPAVEQVARRDDRQCLAEAVSGVDVRRFADAFLTLAERCDDPWKTVFLIECVLRHQRPDEGLLDKALRVLEAGAEAGLIAPEEHLRRLTTLVWMNPTVEGLERILSLVAGGRHSRFDWQDLLAFGQALSEPVRTAFVERVVATMCARDDAPLWWLDSLQVELPVPLRRRLVESRLRWGRVHRDAEYVSATLMLLAELTDDARRCAELTDEALALREAIGDGRDQVVAMARLADSPECVATRIREALDTHPEMARLALWRALPDRWFEAFPDDAIRAAEDEWRYGARWGPDSSGLLPRLAAVRERGGDAVHARYGVAMREQLARADEAMRPPIETFRRLTSEQWFSLYHETGDDRHQRANALMMDLDRALPFLTLDEVRGWLPRVPLDHMRRFCALVLRLPEDERPPWVEEAWAWATALRGVDRGVQMSIALSVLPEARRREVLGDVLAEIGDYERGGGSSSNRQSILLNTARWLSARHLDAVVEQADVQWQTNATNLRVFLHHAPPPFRSLFTRAFAERIRGDANPQRLISVLLPLIATESGVDPSFIDDWGEAAVRNQMPDGWTVHRLAERLDVGRLASFVHAWMSDRRKQRTSHIIGPLTAALLKRSPDPHGVRRSIYRPLIERLFGSSTRSDVLTFLSDLGDVLSRIAERPVGDALALAIDEVGRRWP